MARTDARTSSREWAMSTRLTAADDDLRPKLEGADRVGTKRKPRPCDDGGKEPRALGPRARNGCANRGRGPGRAATGSSPDKVEKRARPIARTAAREPVHGRGHQPGRRDRYR